MAWQGKEDPMEAATERWLNTNKLRYLRADHTNGLDFYLPDFDLYIEVKRFHSPRIAEQMSRAENVIAIQGIKSFGFLNDLIYWKRARDESKNGAPKAAAGEGENEKQGGGAASPRKDGAHGPHMGAAQPRQSRSVLTLASEPALRRVGN